MPAGRHSFTNTVCRFWQLFTEASRSMFTRAFLGTIRAFTSCGKATVAFRRAVCRRVRMCAGIRCVEMAYGLPVSGTVRDGVPEMTGAAAGENCTGRKAKCGLIASLDLTVCIRYDRPCSGHLYKTSSCRCGSTASANAPCRR